MSEKAVMVAHRDLMVAEGIAAALAVYPGVVPIGVFTSATVVEQDAVRADAVALDAGLPGAERTADRLRRGGVRVVLIRESACDEDEGVSVLQSSSVARLASALVPGAIQPTPRTSRLTPREQEVLNLVSRGLAGKQVARHLGISPKTVERHKTRIFLKLGVRNQTAAVRAAVDRGFARSGSWT